MMEKKRAAKANLSVDELATQLSVTRGAYTTQISTAIESQYANNVAVLHQCDQNFADVKPNEVKTLLDELEGY